MIIPDNYKLRLLPETTEIALAEIYSRFEKELAERLKLRHVEAPLSPGKSPANGRLELPLTFAPWKAETLRRYDIPAGYGIYAHTRTLDGHAPNNFHAPVDDLYDWAVTATDDLRFSHNGDLMTGVYDAMYATQQFLFSRFPHITPQLPPEIVGYGAERGGLPDAAIKKHGAAMVADEYTLNADIYVWSTVLDAPMHLANSRVLPAGDGCPACVSGTVRRSAMAMYLLQKAHIGEVQPVVWPASQARACADAGIELMK